MKSHFLLSTLIACMIVATTMADILHVSPSGDDGNAGTEAEPLRTVSRALSRGDSIALERDGEYDAIRPSPRTRLHVTAYGEGARPIIRGNHAVRTWAGDVIDDVQIESLRLIGDGTSDAIHWMGHGENVTFRDMVIENHVTGAVVQTRTDDRFGKVTFEDIAFFNIGRSSGSGHSQGIYIADTDRVVGRRLFFDRVGFHHDIEIGTMFNHPIYGHETCNYFVWEDNVVTRTFADGAMLRGPAEVRRNVVYRAPIGFLLGWGNHRDATSIIEDNLIYWTNDIRPDLPRRTGLYFRPISHVVMSRNQFIGAHDGGDYSHVLIRHDDYDITWEAEDNVYAGYDRVARPSWLGTHPELQTMAALTEIDLPHRIDLDPWIDQARKHWGESPYTAADLQAILLGEADYQPPVDEPGEDGELVTHLRATIAALEQVIEALEREQQRDDTDTEDLRAELHQVRAELSEAEAKLTAIADILD